MDAKEYLELAKKQDKNVSEQDLMVEFARIKVKEALEAITYNISPRVDFEGRLEKLHQKMKFIEGEDYTVFTLRGQIYQCYSLSNIK